MTFYRIFLWRTYSNYIGFHYFFKFYYFNIQISFFSPFQVFICFSIFSIFCFILVFSYFYFIFQFRFCFLFSISFFFIFIFFSFSFFSFVFHFSFLKYPFSNITTGSVTRPWYHIIICVRFFVTKFKLPNIKFFAFKKNIEKSENCKKINKFLYSPEKHHVMVN